MEFKEFLETLKNKVQEYVGDNIIVTLQHTNKVNIGEKCGLSFRKITNNMASIIYIDDLYGSDIWEKDLEGCVETVIDRYTAKDFTAIPDVSFVIDWEAVKEQIRILMIGYSANAILLKDIPYRKYLNLAITYVIPIENGKIRITNRFLTKWCITEKTLYEKALENIEKYEMPGIKGLCEIVEEGKENLELTLVDMNMLKEMSQVKEPAMFVLTNSSKEFGASGILCTNILKKLAFLHNANFYLLPSSIHEWIIFIDNGSVTAESLREMVKEINATVVDPEEILSNSLYYYYKNDNEVKVILY